MDRMRIWSWEDRGGEDIQNYKHKLGVAELLDIWNQAESITSAFGSWKENWEDGENTGIATGRDRGVDSAKAEAGWRVTVHGGMRETVATARGRATEK